MKNVSRPNFQGMCLVAEEGYKNMRWFDQFEPEIRERLRNSPFNLCPACVNPLVPADEALRTIEKFEQELRRQEQLQGAPPAF